jgi:hyperosmotically inducible periplasmic protein
MRVKTMLAVITALVLCLGIWGCSKNRASNPSYKDAVSSAIDRDGFKDVKVDEDRDKGVITLDGKVRSEDEKAKAEDDAKAAAPGMIVANQISVQPEGVEGEAKKIDNSLDSGIKDNLKAAFTQARLDKQHIDADVDNGVVKLKGDVDNAAQREQAEKIAASVPNVQQVVNELEVKGGHKKGAAASGR